MKYRHAFHAGNFADVHKHVTLLALIEALQRKEKGFFYLETHAARGAYELKGEEPAEWRRGIERLMASSPQAAELQAYKNAHARFRKRRGSTHAYAGSPLLAAEALRQQDRGVFIELLPTEARSLEHSLPAHPHVRVECGDGFERMRAHLPPGERRGLTFIDPPYEETRLDFDRVRSAMLESLRKFATGIVAVWYPIKQEAEIAAWHASCARATNRPLLACELWIYPRDSRVALNGSGMLIANPPYLMAERMQVWLPELQSILDPERLGGFRAQALS